MLIRGGSLIISDFLLKIVFHIHFQHQHSLRKMVCVAMVTIQITETSRSAEILEHEIKTHKPFLSLLISSLKCSFRYYLVLKRYGYFKQH